MYMTCRLFQVKDFSEPKEILNILDKRDAVLIFYCFETWRMIYALQSASSKF